MRVEESVKIRRSPEDVWAFVVDHVNDPRWCKKVKSVEPAGERRWSVTHKPVPLRPPMTLALEQLRADRPKLLILREEDRASVFEVTYLLEADGHGTRFTQTSEFEWKTLPKVLRAAFGRGVRRDVQRQLRDLKHVLEAH
jgi:uncharacterized protein YndB with AHSA1/START domain